MASDESDFCHAVEDFFAALRGGPHLLSPKDIHLVRGWWREGIPFAAVSAGISEALARRRERGEVDPLLSLSFCRHAVRRQATQLAELRAGTEAGPAGGAPDPSSFDSAASDLAARLEAAQRQLPPGLEAVAAAVVAVAGQVRAAVGLPPAMLDQHLFALEATLLAACWRALPASEVETLEADARAAVRSSGATGEAVERTLRAMRDRALRERLGLPRLELG